MLVEKTLFPETDVERVTTAIARLREFEPPEGYHLAFSGGKDSIVIKKLADMAGVQYDAHFCRTTVDPPEVTRFTKDSHPTVIFDRPERTMWQLIVAKGPPTRISRFCCKYLKEYSGSGRVVVTGIRWEESFKRKGRKLTEVCMNDSTKRFLHPIIDWSTEDVWQFIRNYNLPYCCLYDEGWRRIGCVLCPMQSKVNRIRDTKRFPGFYKAYLHAFERMLAAKPKRRATWKTAEDVMYWWIYEDSKKNPNQLLFSMFE